MYLRRTTGILAFFCLLAQLQAAVFGADLATVKKVDSLVKSFMVKGERLPKSEDEVRELKAGIKEILKIAEVNEENACLVAERLSECLAEGSVFRGSDYYILWIADDLIDQHGRVERLVIARIIDKVDNVDRTSLPASVRKEIVSFATEFLSDHIEYRDELMDEDAVKGAKWQTFRDWWLSNKHKIEFDAKTRSWNLATR